MPRLAIDYSTSAIYRIVCRDVDIKETYVGSTTNFIKRKAAHKYNCQNPNSKTYNVYVYQFIRANGGWDNWDMVIIERPPVASKEELHTRERYHIEEFKAQLNKCIPTRTGVEYYIDHKEDLLQQNKQYRADHKEEIKQKNKQNYTNNKEALKQVKLCECGGTYTSIHKIRHQRTAKHRNSL